MNYVRKLLYPSGKVHPLYCKYIGWSFVSNIAVSAQQVLSTHSMLATVSTYDTDSIRTLNYIGKDLIGQIGGLLCIAKLGKSIDKSPTKFLNKANILQQTAYIATSITPLVSEYFLPVAGAANVLTNVSFIGFGAVNAKCIQAMSIDNNIGEVYAKISIFNTAGSSIGMLIGMFLTVLIPEHDLRICLTPLIGVVRVLTFNMAVRGLLE
jgi:hypothetical protein